MKEAYITQLTEVEKALEENNGAFSDAIIERLSALVTEMKGMRISAEEYLKVMQLFFRKYEKERNREGQHYCAIRMLQLQRYLKSRSSKHQKYELIIDREIPQTYEAYIYDKSRFYRETFRMLQQRLLLMTVVLFIALFILLSLLLNQTMLDFSNATNAAYADNHYENNGIKVTENFNFVKEIWDQIKDKEALNALIGDLAIDDVKIGNAVVDIPVAGILKQIIGKDTLANLLPDLLAKIEGNMSVSGDVDGGVFTSLDATLAGTRISLTQDNVNYIVENVVNPILGGISMDGTVKGIVDNVIKGVTEGTAYISLGTITVSSTFTVE